MYLWTISKKQKRKKKSKRRGKTRGENIYPRRRYVLYIYEKVYLISARPETVMRLKALIIIVQMI